MLCGKKPKQDNKQTVYLKEDNKVLAQKLITLLFLSCSQSLLLLSLNLPSISTWGLVWIRLLLLMYFSNTFTLIPAFRETPAVIYMSLPAPQFFSYLLHLYISSKIFDLLTLLADAFSFVQFSLRGKTNFKVQSLTLINPRPHFQYYWC